MATFILVMFMEFIANAKDIFLFQETLFLKRVHRLRMHRMVTGFLDLLFKQKILMLLSQVLKRV